MSIRHNICKNYKLDVRQIHSAYEPSLQYRVKTSGNCFFVLLTRFSQLLFVTQHNYITY